MNNAFSKSILISDVSCNFFSNLTKSVEDILAQSFPSEINGPVVLSFTFYSQNKMNLLGLCGTKIVDSYNAHFKQKRITMIRFSLGHFISEKREWHEYFPVDRSPYKEKWKGELIFSGVLMLKNQDVKIDQSFNNLTDFLHGGAPNSAFVREGELINEFNASFVKARLPYRNLFFYFQGFYVERYSDSN